MKKFLTAPQNLKTYGRKHFPADEYYFGSDPASAKVGSGGGTVNLLYQAYIDENAGCTFNEWLGREKRLLIHAGGQSRRLPAYAAAGKVLAPIPVFKWKRGQRIDQTLLDLQLPLYGEILTKAPPRLNTLVASGDVLIRNEGVLPPVPDADIVCIGLWEQPEKATNHGVFFLEKTRAGELAMAVQKPSLEKIQELQEQHHFVIDTGIWLLSAKAMDILFRRCGYNTGETAFGNGVPGFYDLYTTFGQALGKRPVIADEEINALSAAVVALPKGEFYHFGTSAELLESTSRLQSIVRDQHAILHNKVKPHADLYTQNALTGIRFGSNNASVWIENSCIAPGWSIESRHVITGVPQNDWALHLPAETCLDLVPVGNEDDWCARVYGYYNPQLPVRGLHAGQTTVNDWYHEPLYPVFSRSHLTSETLQHLIDNPFDTANLPGKKALLSAATIADTVNLERQFAQRQEFMHQNLAAMAGNWKKSVFHQLDLKHTAAIYGAAGLSLPPELPADAPLFISLHDNMFRSEVMNHNPAIIHPNKNAAAYENSAFGLLRETIMDSAKKMTVLPKLHVLSDQIVWGRSPVRLDIAGGWTDTPPYCLINGGRVVNIAIELNGQPPLQVFIKPVPEFTITLRSIDLGAQEKISSYAGLEQFNTVGSAFSIPKAALCLAGFSPAFSTAQFASLEEQLREFGAGIELTLLAAIPKGSGLGTSSILAGTVLGTLNDFCGLGWDKHTICTRTLILEQMLTTGGGWQDQFGGIFHGVKLLESTPGVLQHPNVLWGPDQMFSDPAASTILIYYTGITRLAKNILAEIVKGMFLNGKEYLGILEEMKAHSTATFEAIQRGDLHQVALATGMSWELNKRLDSGTSTPEIQSIIDRIQDYVVSCKLPGAGGGGYMIIFAKDIAAAAHIKAILNSRPLNSRARFVDWNVSKTGLMVSRS